MIIETRTSMAKGYHYSDGEMAFLKANWRTMTDEEIGKQLGRSPESVARKRKSIGLVKRSGRPSREEVKEAKLENAHRHPSTSNLAALDKTERLEIYKKNFNRNPRYPSLKKELHNDEMELYKHKYVDFMDSVETITIQEEDSLHHMIMADMSISRIRCKIKDMEEENDMNDRPLVFGLYDSLDKAEKKFMEYQKILRVTRESRLKENKEEKETFATMVNLYRSKAVREEMGRQAGLMSKYKDMCENDMKTRRYLLGD
jgi:hypothetical protein